MSRVVYSNQFMNLLEPPKISNMELMNRVWPNTREKMLEEQKIEKWILKPFYFLVFLGIIHFMKPTYSILSSFF